ncbi:ABC transporter ATP-binding protein [Cupriavidus sp. WKF15]|uniref:ABC transporter ATP-binding protein n=1 Tax=Cupriavidus sp. WKF15 TaxID=3032282 RepID=UPI0023E1F347|nr:ABC transporter ATP-binding protein [Cupriavidus sp. WKF15]WER47837.1 ABC transporter ATP-binding protein [Cupriavidus sp. WKF15]
MIHSAVLPVATRAAASGVSVDGSSTAIGLVDLSISFGALRVVDGVSLTIRRGERRLLLGPNGAGKTTLLNLIAGDLRATRGRISLLGQDVTAKPTHARARMGLGRTYQILTPFRDKTLLQNVLMSLTGKSTTPDRLSPWKRFGGSALEAEARAVLARVDLEVRAETPVHACSYGELRRLEIAMALAQQPSILLLDEPLAGLSGAERVGVAELLSHLPKALTIVMVEHDMDVALSFAESITVLQSGRVVVDGDKRSVLADPRTQEIYLGH